MSLEFASFPAAIRCADLTLEVLKRDYGFYCNVYAEDGIIWWTNSGGGGNGGPIDNFLSVLRLDNNYAFGPPKKQGKWTIDRLDKVGAVGVYKLKSARI